MATRSGGPWTGRGGLCRSEAYEAGAIREAALRELGLERTEQRVEIAIPEVARTQARHA